MAGDGIFRCFLCKKKYLNGHKIDVMVCPTSQKKIKDVLYYIARISQVELHISQGEKLCLKCYGQLVEYDSMICEAVKKQRRLSQLIEYAALDIDSDCERQLSKDMDSFMEYTNDNFISDEEISDREIMQTVDEVSGKHRDSSKIHDTAGTLAHRSKVAQALYPCNFCAMRFKSTFRLHKHISQVHKKYSCESCDFSHRNEDYVMLHMNIHEGRRENQCRFCDKEFTTKISTIRHMEVHFDAKKYQCDKCGLCFSQTTVLYNHKLQHEAEETPLSCKLCSQVFKTKRTYRHHMITHRADRPRHTCDVCGKTFTEKYTLKVHKRTHPEPAQITNVLRTDTAVEQSSDCSAPKFSCIICEQAFMQKDHLNKHMQKEHDVIIQSLTLTNFSYDQKRSCHICGQMFSTKINLDCHLETVHGVLIQ